MSVARSTERPKLLRSKTEIARRKSKSWMRARINLLKSWAGASTSLTRRSEARVACILPPTCPHPSTTPSSKTTSQALRICNRASWAVPIWIRPVRLPMLVPVLDNWNKCKFRVKPRSRSRTSHKRLMTLSRPMCRRQTFSLHSVKRRIKVKLANL